MAKLEGTVSVTGLPPHRGLMISLCFYEVGSADASAPHGGDPPTEAATDCHQVAKQVDLHTEVVQPSYDLPFSIEHRAGFYYLQVRAILFRFHGGKMLAQAEQFFSGRRPLVLPEPSISVTLPVAWPTLAPEELHLYGVIKPTDSDT
jgi:hypothetical protein